MEANQEAAEVIKRGEVLGEKAYDETFLEIVEKHREDINAKIEEVNREAEDEEKLILQEIEKDVQALRLELSKNVKMAVEALLEEITI